MDTEHLVRRAAEGDLPAFVELTRRFQHFAFASALTLVGDFHHAEDVVQEALVAAWSSLPCLTEPNAFPGWLRSIVRHHAFRAMRRTHLEELPLEVASGVASGDDMPDERIGQRQQIHAVLEAIAELPGSQREPATLFYMHECSHQDIALFLGLSATTVNNRLHAARSKLKDRMLTMVSETLHSHGLPDDFANRVGRLIEACGQVVEANFDPDALPDLLAELLLSDETNGVPITVRVVQRPGGGTVRGVTITPVDRVPRGASLLNSLRHASDPFDRDTFERAVTLLAGPPVTGETGRLLETGIKVVDVMCPLVTGGTVAIAGEYGAGTTVVIEELVRRLSNGADRVSLFALIQKWDGEGEPGFSHAEALKKDGFSEGTTGAVQTFFFRAAEGPWNPDRLDGLASVDSVIHLARGMAVRGIYPCVDAATSRSRLIDTSTIDAAHAVIATRARKALSLLWSGACGDAVVLERARKLANYFSQPFFCAEPWTKRPGVHVPLAEALKTCADILDGVYDELLTGAFYFAGGIDEIRARAIGAG
jgi:RNA polymerase sigma factor (sigma-70 family)